MRLRIDDQFATLADLLPDMVEARLASKNWS